jgi:hypothetical protein
MPEEATTPDLVELVRVVEAAHRRDFDAAESFFSDDFPAIGTRTRRSATGVRKALCVTCRRARRLVSRASALGGFCWWRRWMLDGRAP